MCHCTGGSEKNPGIRHRPQRKGQPLETFLRDKWPRILSEWGDSTMWWLKAWATPKREKGEKGPFTVSAQVQSLVGKILQAVHYGE